MNLAHDTFGHHLRDALMHLHDPVYLQSNSLGRFAAPGQEASATEHGKALRQGLLDAIGALRPADTDTPTAETVRRFRLLDLRYVQGLDARVVQARITASTSVP